MISSNVRQIFLMIGLLALVGLYGCSSGGDDTPVVPDAPDTAAEFSARAWGYFETEHYDNALDDFASALVLDGGYGEAMAGQGWCRLALAISVSDATSGIGNFDQALAAGENESYVLAGLAAAQLASGGDNLALAITNAGSVLSADPGFVFEHQISFDSKDLLLIRAFAYAVVGEYALALDQADLIDDSEMDENDSSSWLVAGIAYGSFSAATLAHLHQLSEQYSG